MGKAKRAAKKDKRENKELAAQAKLAEEARRRRGRIISLTVPVVFLALAAGAYWGLENPSLAGVTLLGGAGIWLLLALGILGSGISPRDRDKAGSIDFGNRG